MATRICASPVFDEVNNAVNGVQTTGHTTWNTVVSDGDTVVIPAGSATWSTLLTVPRAITLQGAGIGSTIISDGVSSGPLNTWSLRAGFTSRLTGIEFQNGGRTTPGLAPVGVINISGLNTNGSQLRLDHCKFNLYGAVVFNTVIGVIDHNTFLQNIFPDTIYIYGSYWDGAQATNGQYYGDGSWAAPTNFGSSQFLFLEDNTFTHSGSSVPFAIDAFGGARYVFRYNAIFDANVGCHGTESAGRIRGGRAIEIYNNTYTGSGITRNLGGSRSGVVLLHDNTITGFQSVPLYGLNAYRNFVSFSPWGGADGTNVWDVNDTADHTGNGFGGSTGGIFATGTASGSSGTVMTANGSPGWTTNQWAGYELRRTSGSGPGQTFGLITSNTASTITYQDTSGFGANLSFASGNSFEIRKVIQALDSPGRARGSLITGGDPPTSTPAGWNDQVTEPCYAWNNGAAILSAQNNLVNGVHFFNGTPMPSYTPFVYPHPLVSGQVGVPPAVTSSSSASGTVGIVFSYQILATNTPTSYGATPLPSGLSINSSTGLLSGTPTVAGIYSITISAANAFGTGTAVLTLTVQTVAVTLFPPVISSSTSAFGIQNTAFSYQITATRSPTSYSASPLPAGLAINSGTGLISGTPTAVAVTNVTIGATNADGTGTAVLVLTITAAAPTPVGRHPKKWRNTLLRRRNIR